MENSGNDGLDILYKIDLMPHHRDIFIRTMAKKERWRDVGNEYMLTRERIRQINAKVLRKIREYERKQLQLEMVS